MGAYLVVCRGKSAEEAWVYFENVQPPFKPFRDAICGECSYECTVFKKYNFFLDFGLLTWVRVWDEIRLV